MWCGVVGFFFFPFLIGKKLCSVCLVTELCQRRVRAEVSCLVLVLVTDCCKSNSGIGVTEEMCPGNLNFISCTSGIFCYAHVPSLNGSCLRSDPLAAGFITENVFCVDAA